MNEEVIAMSLANAAKWEREGEMVWVQGCLQTALMGYLSIAVSNFDESNAGVAWLLENSVAQRLEQCRRAMSKLLADVDSGKRPASVIGGVYCILAFAHIGWLVGQIETSRWFVHLTERTDLMKLTTPFWREYTRALSCLIRREPYEVAQVMDLQGQQRYLYSYLRLIADASFGRPLDSAITTLDEVLAVRNADESIRDDSYEVEGSAYHPVRWDFRRESLFVLIRK